VASLSLRLAQLPVHNVVRPPAPVAVVPLRAARPTVAQPKAVPLVVARLLPALRAPVPPRVAALRAPVPDRLVLRAAAAPHLPAPLRVTPLAAVRALAAQLELARRKPDGARFGCDRGAVLLVPSVTSLLLRLSKADSLSRCGLPEPKGRTGRLEKAARGCRNLRAVLSVYKCGIRCAQSRGASPPRAISNQPDGLSSAVSTWPRCIASQADPPRMGGSWDPA